MRRWDVNSGRIRPQCQLKATMFFKYKSTHVDLGLDYKGSEECIPPSNAARVASALQAVMVNPAQRCAEPNPLLQFNSRILTSHRPEERCDWLPSSAALSSCSSSSEQDSHRLCARPRALLSFQTHLLVRCTNNRA